VTEPAANPFAPLAAAFERAAAALRKSDVFTEEQAFHAVTQLDAAMQAAPAFCAAVPALFDRAGGGGSRVAAENQRLAERIDEYSTLVKERQRQLAARTGKRQELEGLTAQAEILQAEIDEYERKERLANHLPTLREERARWETRLVELLRDVTDEELLLAAAGEAVSAELARHLDLVTASVRTAASRLAELQVQLAAQVDEVRGLNARVEEAKRELEEKRQLGTETQVRLTAIREEIGLTVSEYRAHAAAEQAVLTGLSLLDGGGKGGRDEQDGPDPQAIAKQALTEIGQRLADVENALTAALDDATANEVRRRGERHMGDAPAAEAG
jgi:DNA repair exonuclease SbcCD ATPase subunit